MLKHIIFDLDDTLIKTQQGYDKINKNNAKTLLCLLKEPKITLDEIFNVKDKIDLENTKKFGLGKERFPATWKDVYYFFASKCGREINNEHANLLYSYAKEIFNMVLDTYGNIHSYLHEFRKLNAELVLLTAGDLEVQNKRVDDYELNKYFNHIYVYPQKTTKTMNEVLKQRDATKTVMIGNSLRSDIYPALQQNLFAIHIERSTWTYDRYKVDFDNPKYFRVHNLEETLEVLQNLITQ